MQAVHESMPSGAAAAGVVVVGAAVAGAAADGACVVGAAVEGTPAKAISHSTPLPDYM